MISGEYSIMKKNIFLILIIAAAIFFSGCTMEEEEITISCLTPEETMPVQTPTPVETTELTPGETRAPGNETASSWKADGIIGDDEYANNITGFRDLFYIYWTSDNDTLYMGMKGKTPGWVSVGFNPTVGMRDSDIIIGGNQGTGGEVYIYDMYSIGTYGPHPSDTAIGGTFDVEEYGASEKKAYTTVEFSRKLDTGDSYDSVLEKGESAEVLWSLSYSDAIETKHNAGKGSVEIII